MLGDHLYLAEVALFLFRSDEDFEDLPDCLETEDGSIKLLPSVSNYFPIDAASYSRRRKSLSASL